MWVLRYDGNDDETNITGSFDWRELSITLWVKVVTWTDFRRVFDQVEDANNEALFVLANTGRLFFSFQTVDGTGRINLNGSITEGDGLWHFYTIAISETDDRADMFEDGSLQTFDSSLSNLIDLSAETLNLAGAGGSGNVEIGPVAIHTRRLTLPDHQRLYRTMGDFSGIG
jgi:hypothetical protein